jgi:hypothetical protein
MPAVARMAVPRTYDGMLFQKAALTDQGKRPRVEQSDTQASPVQRNDTQPGELQGGSQQDSGLLQQQEYRITVIGVASHPAKADTSLIAGRFKKQNTDATEVVAIQVNDRTLVRHQKDERVPHREIQALREGQEIVVEGPKSKRGVLRARSITIAKK